VPVDLRERAAIVTGGGRGIGRSIALGYARAGADVVISAARHRAEADAVVAEGATLPGGIEAIRADVTVQRDVERLVERALSLRGRIDVLVNNAARGMRFVNEQFMTEPRPFWEADPTAWRMVMETNTTGVFLMSRAALPSMLAAGGGNIINLLAPGGATATGMIPDSAPAGIELLSPEIVVPGALHLAVTERSGQRIVAAEWDEPA